LIRRFGIGEVDSGQEGSLRDGSVMPMRGKSATCRTLALKELAVCDRKGRSETCGGKSTRRRQVADLPRIGMAKAITMKFLAFGG